MEFIDFKAINVEISSEIMNSQEVIRVVKPLDNLIPDTDTYAKLKDCEFHNGTIQVKVYSRLLKEAPEYARGFIGIVFRVNDIDNEFESFYIRPTNGRHIDPIRRAHACQYFSYPGYTFDYFRKHAIKGYEAEADIGLEEWIEIKAVIKEDTGVFFVNDMEHPVLTVTDLKHGKDAVGSVGFYTDIGTEGFFKDLEVTID